MDTKPIFSFLAELTRCDYHEGCGKPLEVFTYNGISYAQGRETYQIILNDKFNDFKSCVLEISLQNKEALFPVLREFQKADEETYYDIPDGDYICQMERDALSNDNKSLRQSIREAYFLKEMVSLQKWFIQEAISFLCGFVGESKTRTKKNAAENHEEQKESRLEKKLSEYGEYLSVNDLTEIFGVTSRTITNWEDNGIITNVSPKSEEVNSLGRKKRGQEKRYRKDAIIRSVLLQEKYNAKN